MDKLGLDVPISNFKNKAFRVSTCSYLWKTSTYKDHGIIDMENTYTCKDKFCTYCKKMKQAIRMAKFIPELENYDNLYHMVLTVPSVNGECLYNTIKRMQRAFTKLIEYLKVKEKIKGLDFELYGYEGALRSLEVTYKGLMYHPHFHVVLTMKNYPEREKNISNAYSYNNRDGLKELTRLFNEDEILIQKIWRLLYDGKKVNMININMQDIGYSCMIDRLEGEDSYVEIFKYISKGRQEVLEDETHKGMSKRNFEHLYWGLLSVRQIQGYGCFYNLKVDEDEEAKIMDSNYLKALDEEEMNEIRKNEKHLEKGLKTLKVLHEEKEYMVLFRKKTLKYLKQIYQNSED